MKIAIVGTGIAGLSAGWLLNQSGHQVTLLERNSTLGMDANSFDLTTDTIGESGPASTNRVDLPLRMFNHSMWPNLARIYQTNGVETESVDPSKSFSDYGSKANFVLGKSYQSAAPLRFLFNSKARNVGRGIQKMMAEVPQDLAEDRLDGIDFLSYLQQRNYSDTFIFKFLFPSLASTVCTCSYESLERFPAKTVLHAMWLLADQPDLLRAKHGAQDVVNRLTIGIPDVRCGTTVASVVMLDHEVQIDFADHESLCVDHLIIATQANSAAKILPQISQREKAMLNSFTYEHIDVVVHRDPSLMPIRKSDWRHFNLISKPENTAAMCSVWMNRFCPDWNLETPVFQTIGPIKAPAANSILSESRLQRPIVNESSLEGLRLLEDLHNDTNRRIWFTGSYASPGVPLLESGVVSSMRVVEALQVDLPIALGPSVG